MGTTNETMRLCIDVLRETWDEFYASDEIYCRNQLQLLQSTTPAADFSHETPSQQPPYTDINDTLQEIVIPDFLDFGPTSAYESCLPLDDNRYIGDDPEAMEFFPFADDPSFNLEAYAEEYRHVFQWMESSSDPDLEAVTLEASRRLHVTHGISFEQIDRAQIFPNQLRAIQPEYAEFGLLHKSTQRDYPQFPLSLSPSMFSEYFDSQDVTPRATYKQKLVHEFCFHLDCIVGYCDTHGTRTAFPQRQNPTLPIASWAEEDVELLETLLWLEPDALPCDIAVIVRKPCREVFSYRRQQVRDEHVHPEDKTKRRATSKVISRWQENTQYAEFVPLRVCILYVHQFGSPFVRVPEKLSALTLEPVPRAVHASMPASESSSAKPIPCVNRAVQSRFSKVRKSKSGSPNTALVHSSAKARKKNDLIVEYAGEVISSSTAISRSAIYNHVRRNYLFDALGGGRKVIDAFFRGNVARFINHREGKPANTFARPFLVNGTPRIGIYANRPLLPLTELTFDYGDVFVFNPTSAA
ncbi:hypothetical protein ONZ45_g14785 [Pleurotus djamor]|nr:hypothetical protein ONZ45_g14785 [Pleurotus djamor]